MTAQAPEEQSAQTENRRPNIMRAIRGLGYGALIGMGAGVVFGLAVALLVAVGLFVRSGEGAPTEALPGIVVVGLFGSLIGGIIGAIAGAVLGLAYGATRTERYARWITPVFLLLALAALYNDEFDATIGFEDGLVITAAVGLLALLGFIGGVVFERQTTGDAPGFAGGPTGCIDGAALRLS